MCTIDWAFRSYRVARGYQRLRNRLGRWHFPSSRDGQMADSSFVKTPNRHGGYDRMRESVRPCVRADLRRGRDVGNE